MSDCITVYCYTYDHTTRSQLTTPRYADMTVHEKTPICPMRTSLRLDNNADTKMLNDLNLRNSTIRSLASVFTVGVEPMAGRIDSKSTMPKDKGKPSAGMSNCNCGPK